MNQQPAAEAPSIGIEFPSEGITVNQVVIEGLTYLVWHEAERFFVRSVTTGNVAELFDLDALNRFMKVLRKSLANRAAESKARKVTVWPLSQSSKPQVAPQPWYRGWELLNESGYCKPAVPLFYLPAGPAIAGLLPAGEPVQVIAGLLSAGPAVALGPTALRERR